MPFQRPDLKTINDRIGTDIAARMPGVDASLRRSVAGVLARSEAGAVHSLYGHQIYIADQVMPDTAETEYLERWSRIWGVARKAPQRARGTAIATGTDAAVIVAGTVVQRGDGARYVVTEEAAIAGGAASLVLEAETAGEAGNTAAGTLTFLEPVAGVDATVAISAGGLSQGSDAEGDASLRSRVLRRIQQPPHGGAHHDYVAWALDRDAHGIDVTRAWVAPEQYGPGTVAVRFVMDDTYPDGIPSQADVDAVAASIEAVKPVTARLYVVAPVAAPLTVRIANLTPSTQAVRDAIEAEIRDLILREAEPGGTLLISRIREAISVAASEYDHRLVAPLEDVRVPKGVITTFGQMEWS
ncbi:MAG: baseplate J/gp47 family protein [Thalassobaculaceae bacterium]